MRQLPYLMGRLFNVPLLVHPARLQAFMLGLPALIGVEGFKALPGPLVLLRPEDSPLRPLAFDQDEEAAAAQAAVEERSQRYYGIQRAVATIPVHGALVRRAGQVDGDCTPLTSYEHVGNALNRAMRDSRVRGVMLDIDSPGGESSQLFDLARQIRAANAVKPVWAMANDDALSAGYALASSAGRVFTTETGALGSIGTVAQHVNQEGYDRNQGLKYTYIFSGAHKVDGNPHSELTPGAVADIQGEVDRIQSLFVNHVADHRKMSPDAVRGTEARIFFGRDALHQGLADDIGTPAQAHAALAEHVNPVTARRSTGAMSEHQQPHDPANDPPRPVTEPGNDPPPVPVTDPPDPPEPEAAREMNDMGNIVSFSSAPITRADASRIVAACILAGMPEKAPGFIAQGMTLNQARGALADAKAEKTAAAQVVPVKTQTAAGPAAVPSEPDINAKAAFQNFNGGR